jgi:hypothetical protein
MKVLISGASGLIGSALGRRLEGAGSSVVRMVRRRAESPLELAWQPGERLDPALVSGLDAVVNLAGRSLAGRWSPRRQREIRDSRLAATRTIARAVAESFRACGKPAVLVSASAIGYYGDRGRELLTEASSCGTGFLAELCREWEAAAMEAATAGVRVLLARFGLVLSRQGGALARMLPAFRFGLGGRLGTGEQLWSWITLEDAAAAIEFMIANGQLSGPVNLTAPEPVSNAEFTRLLARALRRPALLPAPAFALRLAFGEMADEALLSSQRVQPAKLAACGFQWRHPELPAALQAVL